MPNNGSEYEVKLFIEQGFQRKKCPKCNRFFWSLGDKKTCGEPPCNEYSFIGNSPTKKRLNLYEMRELYLEFFEKNGHTRIKRYPIVARWREDVFFTQASIYCFQPWVILGIVKPPANPLTISQTCVRFNDIDNVGKTGRHFTMFEMMAHHAFNTKDNFVYFKDRTVDLCHRLLTDELGINANEISYLEAQWSGGGNSGPCFEALVSGIELATLVFMMYEEKNGKKKEMEMQVVDTGYGLERFTWLSQGNSSAYEAVFGDVLSRLKKEANVHEDEKILSEYSKVAGLMNVESEIDLKILRKKVADRLRISVEKLNEIILPMENLYAICDHTRALMFMLQDGVVPSNVKDGYFARLLVRRTLRSLDFIRLDTSISKIIDMQIDYFKRDFPEIRENKEDILKVINIEEEKYEKTIEKGKSLVKRIEDRLKKEGKERIELDNLIELYDSQGLTPDIVREFSSLEIEVPDDFYIKVAEKHERPESEKEEKKEISIPAGISNTVLGYYKDANVKKFKASVVGKFNNYIVIDKTYFYPEGGGQEADHGRIDSLDVIDVQKIGNVIVHKIRGDRDKVIEGGNVECELDWPRRIQLMQHHTAAHLINGAARRVLGNHVWQTGAYKSTKGARLDITHYSALSNEELNEIENLANNVVKEKREIDIRFMERNKAEREYGFRIYQGGAVPGAIIRIVNSKDWDVEACGGMHFDNTEKVGLIKITGSKRIQDGVVRLEFKAGDAAKKYIMEQKEIAEKVTKKLTRISHEDLPRISSIFSVSVEQLPKTLERFKKEWLDQTRELEILEGRILELEGKKYYFSENYSRLPSGDPYQSSKKLFEQWKSQKKEINILKERCGYHTKKELEKKFDSYFEEKNGVKIVKEIVSGLDMKNLMKIGKEVIKKGGRLLLLINIIDDKVNIIVASNSKFDANEIAKRLSESLNGGSHGDKQFAIGGGSSQNVQKILREFKP